MPFSRLLGRPQQVAGFLLRPERGAVAVERGGRGLEGDRFDGDDDLLEK